MSGSRDSSGQQEVPSLSRFDNSGLQTPAAFSLWKDHTAVGGVLSCGRKLDENCGRETELSCPWHLLCLFLEILLRRKESGVGYRFSFPFSPGSLTCLTSSLSLKALSPQICGQTRNYCFNTFLIYMQIQRVHSGVFGCEEGKAQTRGHCCYSKKDDPTFLTCDWATEATGSQCRLQWLLTGHPVPFIAGFSVLATGSTVGVPTVNQVSHWHCNGILSQ